MTATPKSLRVFAPASVSNLACGFDTLGFAIGGLDGGQGAEPSTGPGDEIRVTATGATDGEPHVTITAISGEQGRLPKDASRNTAGVAATAVLERFRRHSGKGLAIALEVKKCMPLSSGLGSSAASAVGGAVAAYELLQRDHPNVGFSLTEPELLECSLAGELVASGGRHADNVAPCLLGGLVLVRSLNGLPDIVRLPDCSDWLWCALARPEIAIDTSASRQRLGDSVPLPTAIRQWANLGAFVAAIYERDAALLARTLVDHVAEPNRRKDVAGFDHALAAAKAKGALGGSLSGSGPTLFALATSQVQAEAAAQAMANALLDAGHHACDAFTSAVGTNGARVLGESP